MVFLYLLIRWARSINFGPELLHFYGGDLLFIPILMTSTKIAKWLFKFPFEVNKVQVVIAFIYASVTFEWLLPIAGTNFVSDPFDILAYAMGALIYVYIIAKGKNKPIEVHPSIN